MPDKEIKDLTLSELESFLLQNNFKRFQGKQIFDWIYHSGILDFDRMTNLPLALRSFLKVNFRSLSLKKIKESVSSDATTKFLFQLSDKNLIESVIIPNENRVTACISTQAGCKYGCKFCASAIKGFKRNLTTGEILEQIILLNQQMKLTHLVFMGTGEPLDNYDSVIKAIRIINSKEGLNIGARKITISSCGIIPGINKLSKEGLQVELSVSLHAASDDIRSKLMPVNKIYGLENLISACKHYAAVTGRQVTFEYVLIKGLNSDLQSAQFLSKILRGFKLSKVNLIPANPVIELDIQPPEKKEIDLFKGYLLKHGVLTTLRRERGKDIDAACGQLRLKYEK